MHTDPNIRINVYVTSYLFDLPYRFSPKENIFFFFFAQNMMRDEHFIEVMLII